MTAKTTRIFFLKHFFKCFYNPLFPLSAHMYLLPVPSSSWYERGWGVCVCTSEIAFSHMRFGRERREEDSAATRTATSDWSLLEQVSEEETLSDIWDMLGMIWEMTTSFDSEKKYRWILLARKHNFTFPLKNIVKPEAKRSKAATAIFPKRIAIWNILCNAYSK